MTSRACLICDEPLSSDLGVEFIGSYCLECLNCMDEIEVDFIAIKSGEIERVQFEDYLTDRAWNTTT